MKTVSSRSIALLFTAYVSLFVSALSADCGDINPRPGENIHGLTTRIGTEVDIVSSRLCVVESKLDQVDECCPCDFFITQTGIPYTITQPGVYCLAEDVTFTSTEILAAAITINSSCVTLKLQDHTIDGLTQSGIGIIVNMNSNDIIIQNGNIKNTTFVGIIVTGSSRTTLSDLHVSSGGATGIQFSSSFNCIVDDCESYNSTNGFNIVGSSGIVVRNSTGSNNTSNGFFTTSGSTNISLLNCQAQLNQIGFLVDSDNNLLSNCSVSGNSNNGFRVTSVADETILRECNALNNTVNGFDVQDSTNTEIRNSSSVGNSGVGIIGTGSVGLVVCNNLVHGNGTDLVDVMDSNLCNELSAHDQTICSKLIVIDSKIDVIDDEISIHDALICSKIEALEIIVTTSLGDLSNIISILDEIDLDLSIHDQSICSKLEIIDSKIDVIDEDLSAHDQSICSKLEIIDSKIDVIDSVTDIIESKVCEIDISALESKIDVVDDELSIHDQLICSKLLVIETKVDKVDDDLSIHDQLICSKIENVDDDLSIHDQSICSKLIIIESQLDDIDTNLTALTGSNLDSVADKLIEICSLSEIVISKVEIIDSETDHILESLSDLDQIVNVVSIHDAIICSKLIRIESKIDACCPCDFSITQADIPYTITQPGVYCLAEDVTFVAGDAITISTSCVTLDLQEHTILGDASAVDGIVINNNMVDVTVQNGNVKNIFKGVNALGGNERITVRDMHFWFTQNGIRLTSSSSCLIENCNSYFGANGFQFEGTALNIVVKDCIGADNDSSGFLVLAGSAIAFYNCQAQGNVFGFTIIGDQCLLDNCLAANNSSNGFNVSGSADQTIIRSSEAQNNGGDGFIVSSSSNTEIRDCSSVGNTSAGIRGTSATGLVVCNNLVHGNGTDLVDVMDSDICAQLEQCCPCDFFISQADIPYTITQPGVYCLTENVEKTGIGSAIVISSSCVTLDLRDHAIDGIEDGSGGITISANVNDIIIRDGFIKNVLVRGIDIQSNTSRINIYNISLFNCPTAGIRLSNCADSVFENCQADACGTAFAIENLSARCILRDCIGLSGSASGFNVDSSCSDISLYNCQSQNNSINGFFIAGDNCLLSNCLATNNANDGFVANSTANATVFRSCNAQTNSSDGFDVSSSSNTEIRDCSSVTNTSAGMRGTSATDLVVCNNLVHGNGTDLINVMNSDICSKLDALELDQCCPCDFFIRQEDIPYTISQPGVYCLAEDVDAPFAAAINITATCVVLDLQGHTINSQNLGIGIATTGFVARYIQITNGTIKNATTGIALSAADVEVSDITVAQSGTGITTAAGTNLRNCYVTNCTANGIQLFSRALVQDCVVRDCNNGFSAVFQTECTVANCQAINNNSDGFNFAGGSNHLIRECSAITNTAAGFNISASDCQLRDSSSIKNGTGILNTGLNLVVCNNIVNSNATDLSGVMDSNLCNALTDLRMSTSLCCPCDFFITQADIPYTITQPGKYCLAESVLFTTGIAIDIQSSDVTLDLNNRIMRATTNVGTTGINIGSFEAVTVRNGTIDNNEEGIISAGSGVRIGNITVQNSRSRGIDITGGTGSVITDCLIRDVISVSGGSGIHEAAAAINNCFINCKVDNSNFYGFLIEGEESLFEKCVATDSNSTGFSVLGGNIILKACDAMGNTTGFSLSGDNNTAQDCQALDNNIGFTLGGNNNTLNNCESVENSSRGFIISGNDNKLKNCEAVENSSDGFLIEGEFALIKNCQAVTNGQHGFYITGDRSTVRNSEASHNTANGFFLEGNQNVILDNNLASYNGSFGFLLGSDAAPLTAHYQSALGVPIPLTLQLTADRGYRLTDNIGFLNTSGQLIMRVFTVDTTPMGLAPAFFNMNVFPDVGITTDTVGNTIVPSSPTTPVLSKTPVSNTKSNAMLS